MIDSLQNYLLFSCISCWNWGSHRATKWLNKILSQFPGCLLFRMRKAFFFVILRRKKSNWKRSFDLTKWTGKWILGKNERKHPTSFFMPAERKKLRKWPKRFFVFMFRQYFLRFIWLDCLIGFWRFWYFVCIQKQANGSSFPLSIQHHMRISLNKPKSKIAFMIPRGVFLDCVLTDSFFWFFLSNLFSSSRMTSASRFRNILFVLCVAHLTPIGGSSNKEVDWRSFSQLTLIYICNDRNGTFYVRPSCILLIHCFYRNLFPRDFVTNSWNATVKGITTNQCKQLVVTNSGCRIHSVTKAFTNPINDVSVQFLGFVFGCKQAA